LSLERVIEALIGLGLSGVDAEVYVYLAKKEPQTALDLARALNITKQKMYTSLKNLQTKGLVTKEQTLFFALHFEEALGILIKTKKKQAQSMHENKEELLASWKTKE